MTMTPEAAGHLVARAYAEQRSPHHVDVTAVMDRGEARRRRRRRATTAAVTGVASLVLVSATTLVASRTDAPTTGAPAARETGATDVLAVLGRPQTDADRMSPLAATADAPDDQAVLRSSSRLITSVDGVEYYAGTDAQGDVCLAVGWVEAGYGSACAPLAEFDARGVWVGTGDGTDDPSASITVLLLPDHLHEAASTDVTQILARSGIPDNLLSGDVMTLTPNLFVLTPRTP